MHIASLNFFKSAHADKDKVNSSHMTVAFPQYQPLTMSVITMWLRLFCAHEKETAADANIDMIIHVTHLNHSAVCGYTA